VKTNRSGGYTDKPQSISVGTRVRADSRPGAETGTRLATRVTTLEAASTQKGAAGTEARIAAAAKICRVHLRRSCDLAALKVYQLRCFMTAKEYSARKYIGFEYTDIIESELKPLL